MVKCIPYLKLQCILFGILAKRKKIFHTKRSFCVYFYNIIQGKKENGEGLWLILINFEDFSHYMVHGVVWEMVRKTPMHKI